MNEKSKKKEKNVKTCSIDEKDIKNLVESSALKSIDLELKENNHRKSSTNVKMKKIPEEINSQINTGQDSKINRSFSIDLNRKPEAVNFYNALTTSNNALKMKETINHGVIKLYSFSPLKSGAIDVSKEKKTRNTSVNKISVKGNIKKSPKRKNPNHYGINQSQNTAVLNKITNASITASKENNLNSSHKKNKSQNSNNNTPASINIISPSEVHCNGKNKEIKINNDLKTSSKTITNNKSTNKKTIETDKDILNDTARASLSNFKTIITDIVIKNKNNLSFLKELERNFRKVLSQATSKFENVSYTPGNEMYPTEDHNRNDYQKLKCKSDLLEKKLNNVLDENAMMKEQLKEQAQQLTQMKTILSNFQNQLKGISEININDSCKNTGKHEIKSKSVLGSIGSKSKINISLYKYEEKSENPKSPIVDKNITKNKNTFNKNKSQRIIKGSDNVLIKDDIKTLDDSKRNNLHHNTLKVKDQVLENSITSIGSENSTENVKELLYFQNNSKSQQKTNHPSLPKLEFNRSNNDNMKLDSNTANNSEKFDKYSQNSSLLTPETKYDNDNLFNDEMNKQSSKLKISLNKEERAKSSSIELNTNININSLNLRTNDNNPKSTNFLLNLENLPKMDYNQEFLAKYEEFSPSWRNECKKLKGLSSDIDFDLIKLENNES